MEKQSLNQFTNWLAQRLQRPLPGAAAQRQWAPELTYGRHHGPPSHNARRAAVIVVLTPSPEGIQIPLTVRPATIRDHAGQVCLPGGAVEADESTETAALRELHEELGIEPASVRTLGRLSPIYVFVTNFLVTPFVSVADQSLEYQPEPCEVERVIEAPLAVLQNPANHRPREIQRARLRFSAPHFVLNGGDVWGATSMILGELVALANEWRPPSELPNFDD